MKRRGNEEVIKNAVKNVKYKKELVYVKKKKYM